MKKVLLGLLALSAVSMAAAPNLGAAATAGTNVFETGQQGAITVTGRISSDIPVIKYVVYASTDGTASPEENLVLPEFTLTKDVNTAGFAAASQNIYVKRVNGTNYANLEPGDDVEFKLQVDPSYSAVNNGNWITLNNRVEIQPTALLSRATLGDALNAIKDLAAAGQSPIVTNEGLIAYNTTGKFPAYLIPKSIEFSQKNRGVLEVKSVDRTILTNFDQFGDAQYNALNTFFASGKDISNAKVLVRVQ